MCNQVSLAYNCGDLVTSQLMRCSKYWEKQTCSNITAEYSYVSQYCPAHAHQDPNAPKPAVPARAPQPAPEPKPKKAYHSSPLKNSYSL